mgnify:FL=1
MGRGSEQIKNPNNLDELEKLQAGYFQTLGKNPKKYDSKRPWCKSPCFWRSVAVVGGAWAVVGLVGGGYLVYNMLSTGTPIGIPMNTTMLGNATMASGSNLALLGDMVNTTAVPFIVNTTTAAATALTTLLPTAGLVTTLMPNRSNDSNVIATPLSPVYSNDLIEDNDLVKDSMVLSKEIEKDFEENGVSESRIKYWQSKGVNIKEATDPGRVNLLMIAAGNKVPVAVRFLVNEGLDVNKQDVIGNTALHYAVHNSKSNNENATKTIIRDLLASGLNPCIENNKSNKASFYAKSPRIRKLLVDAERKCKA